MAAIEIEFLAEISSAIREVGKLSAGIETEVSKVNKAFSTLGKSLAGALGVFAVGGFFTKAIEEASEFQDQINDVSVAFKNAGISGDFATQSLVEYSGAIQQTTRFSDNAVLTTASLIQNLSRLDSEGLKVATKAALDLSSALRIDLNTASTLVGKAAEGNLIGFARLGIQIQRGRDNAETFANTLKALQSRFGGASEAATKTFGGAIDQLKNNLEDTLKTFGLAIIGGGTVAETINSISKEVIKFNGFLEENKDSISSFVKSLASGASTIRENFVALTTIVGGFLLAINAPAIIAAISAIVTPITTLIAVFGPATIAATAFSLALTATGIGAVIVGFGFLVQYVVKLTQEFGSLGGAIQAVALKFGRFMESVFGEKSRVDKYTEALDKLKKSANESKKPIDDLTQSGINLAKELQKQQAELKVKAQAQLTVDVESIKKDVDRLAAELKNAGKTQLQIATDSFKQTNLKLKEALQNGVLEQDKFNQLTKQNKLKFDAEIAAINKKANDEAIKKEKERADLIKAASSNVSGFAANFKELSKSSSNKDLFASGAVALGNSITQGAEGARQAVSGLLTAGATAMFGPLGQAAGPLIDAFTKGPEAVKQMVKDFLGAIPSIIENVILAIPAFIIALLEAVPVLIDGILKAIPVIIDEINASIPLVIETLTNLAPQIIQTIIDNLPMLISSLVGFMPSISISFALALANQAPFIGVQFAFAFIQQIPTIISSIATGIKDAISKITGGLSGGGGGGGGGISGAIGGITKKLKFAEGGVVPGGAPFTDRIPAMLKPGEVVLNKQQQREVSKETSGGGGGAQAVTINLMIGEEQLASTLVNLTRQGFRLSGV